MNKREAKALGREAGEAAAMYCEVGDEDRKQAGCACDAPAVCLDCLTAAAYSAEENGRQFSPFEFTAHDLNEDEDRADGLWEAFDAGISAGVEAEARRRVRAESR